MPKSRVQANIITYNAVITACEKGEQWLEALRLLKSMPQAAVSSDVISYNATISACEKGGKGYVLVLAPDAPSARRAAAKDEVVRRQAELDDVELAELWRSAVLLAGHHGGFEEMHLNAGNFQNVAHMHLKVWIEKEKFRSLWFDQEVYRKLLDARRKREEARETEDSDARPSLHPWLGSRLAGLDSELLADRLSCGAVVEELRLEGLRLQYTLLEGDGPRKGWVSIRVKDVPLLAPESPQAKVELKRKTVASFRPRIFSSADLERKTEMSMSWDPMQKALFYQSRGRWDPSALARLRAPRNTRRVSVVVPTSSGRRKFHPQLWSCFSAQDWPEKELILIESTKAGSRGSSPRARSPDFSSLAAEDERILYVQSTPQ
eukprot:g7396.t1